MRRRSLGDSGRQVGAVGLGCMRMVDDDASMAVIREALDLGVTMIDTSDVYGDGDNERLVGRALDGRRDDAVLATKVGLTPGQASSPTSRDGSPEHIRAGADGSLSRLGVDVIDLYYLHRVDDAVPLADSWGALADLVAAGKVRRIGLSAVTVDQAAEAHALHPVTAIQSELSLSSCDADPVVDWCAANGAAFVPFAPLGRGLLTGTIDRSRFAADDPRIHSPRYSEKAMAANQRIVDVMRRVAGRHGATPAQVAIAWTLTRGEHVIPIPGTTKSRYLRENVAAVDLVLSEQDRVELATMPETKREGC